MTLAGYRSPSDDVGSGAQRDWTNSCSLNGVNRTWARVQGSRGLRALAYQSDPICNLVSPAPKVARVGGGSSSRTAHFSPKNVGHLSLITRQSAALNHSMIPVASSGLAVAIHSRNWDGVRLMGCPPFVRTELARLRMTPCRAREIITESTRASSAISSSDVSAIVNGMEPFSRPTTITQSNCCPLPTCPLSRWTPGLVMRVAESPT